MATFVNNLRLTEITTGDESGTWGTTTNSNWDFTTDAFGYGVKNMAGDADQTFTMADGTVDTLRSMYLKITSTVAPLTATRTLTIAPNTVSKVWVIENNAAGSQSIIIKQGSGATVTIATGTRAMVYTDGLGSGAAVFLASPTISTLAGILSVASGGTNLAAGTSGGILAYTASGTLASSAALTQYGIVYGGGAGAVPVATASGTTGQVLTATTGSAPTWASPAASVTTLVRSARTSDTILGTADRSTLIDITSGTFSQTFTAAATLTSGWFLYIRNSGTGEITLDPDASELIDGVTSYIMYPGETRLVQCTGTAFTTLVVTPFAKTFTATGSFAKPPGYAYLGYDIQGAGGSGGGGETRAAANARGGAGGGGGASVTGTIPAAALASSETITIGAGGASVAAATDGNNGGNTVALGRTMYGGGGGKNASSAAASGGGGGSWLAAAVVNANAVGTLLAVGVNNNFDGWSSTASVTSSIYGGARGGIGGTNAAGVGGIAEAPSRFSGGGGGGGGGSTLSSFGAGGAGSGPNTSTGVAGGATSGAAGAAGVTLRFSGSGGAGVTLTGTGGAGGLGGPGAGGGGGGGSYNGTGGASGAGGDGFVAIWGIA